MHPVAPSLFALLVVAGSACAQDAKAKPPPGNPKWFADFEQARQQAKGLKLDLMLAFLTADSAGLAAKLESEVFASPLFLTESAKTFLLVRIDVAVDETPVPEPVRKQTAMLRGKYPSRKLPAVWLCDAFGRAYATTGYVPGGPKAFLAWMEDRRQAGIAATAAVMRAGPVRGLERAKILAEGLQGLDDAIVFANYPKEMMEIIKLDADSAAGLKAPFDAIARDGAARPLSVRLQDELQALREQKSWDDLDARIEQQLAEHKGERWAEQCLTFHQGVSRLEGHEDSAGALPLFESALAMAPRSELAPEIVQLREQAAAAVAAEKARAEAARKAEDAKNKKKPGKE